jgi:ABC-type nitrate/sulfonate/bicarbonate transport system substrate-binding protein
MIRRTILAAAFALAAFAAPPAAAQPLTRLNISLQPADFSMFTLWLAQEQGWWREMGIEANFSTFPSGPPQVAAVAANAWDVGITGSAPSVLGASRFNLRTIGISNDESQTNTLMVRAADLAAIRANPASLRGSRVLITVNTTVDYVLQNCLRRWNLTRADLQVVNLAQAQILSAFATGEGRIAGLWAPHNYTAEERMGAVPLCNGTEGGATVPSNIVVREEFLRQNPDLVARFMAVVLRGVVWTRENRAGALASMRRFYAQGGVTISDAAFESEIDRHPTFNLEEHLRIMDRSAGPSQVDQWFQGLTAFLQQVGTVPNPPAPSAFITDEVIRRVAADPRLRAFAQNRPQ